MSTVLDFDPETEARLDRIAALTGQPKSELARELVTLKPPIGWAMSSASAEMGL